MKIVIEILVLLGRLIFICLESFYRAFVDKSPKSIRGKVVLITGAGSGIGRALALKFAEHGAKTALWDVDEENNKNTAEAISSLGVTAHAYTCDVSKTESVREAANQTRRDFGDVDILVNNAGVLIVKDILSLSEAEIRKTFDVNIIAHFWTVKEFLPAMISKNSGHVVTVASMAALIGTPLLTDYGASKHAANGFSQCLSEELRIHYKTTGIKISTVFPLFVGTNLLGRIKERVGSQDRFGRMLSPEEVADSVMEGVLRDKSRIFIPSSASKVRVLGLLPDKFKMYLSDFVGARFFLKKGGE